MIRYQRIVGGAPSSVRGLVHHMMNATERKEAADIIAHFGKEGLKQDITSLAQAIRQNRLTMDEGIDLLMQRWEARNPPPTDDALKAMEDNKVWVDGKRGGHWAPTPAWVDLEAQWETKWYAAERLLSGQLDTMIDRMDRGLHDAHLAVVRPGTHPLVLRGLSIEDDGLLTDREIGALMTGRRADRDHVEGKRYAIPRQGHTPIGSYAFIPSPDKSVSVAWAMASPEDRTRIEDAHLQAARAAMREVALVLGNARVRSADDEPGHVTWLEFTHHTSLATKDARGDMELHTHFVIPNAVFCESGRVGSLDTAALRRVVYDIDTFYNQELAQNLERYGFDVRMDDEKGRVALMADIPEEVSIHFSKRTVEGDGDKRTIQHYKKIAGTRDDVADFDGWRAQVQELGWQPQEIAPRSHQTQDESHHAPVDKPPEHIEQNLPKAPTRSPENAKREQREHRHPQKIPSLDEHNSGSPKHVWEWQQHGQRM